MAIEDHEKHFGDIAIKKGFISREQFAEAFEIHVKESIEKQETRPIGEILVSLGYITDAQIIEVVKHKRNLEKG